MAGYVSSLPPIYIPHGKGIEINVTHAVMAIHVSGINPSSLPSSKRNRTATPYIFISFLPPPSLIDFKQVMCWIAQFVGHFVFEGRAPALMTNLYQARFPFLISLPCALHPSPPSCSCPPALFPVIRCSLTPSCYSIFIITLGFPPHFVFLIPPSFSASLFPSPRPS